MASSKVASTQNKLYIVFNNFTGEQYLDLAQSLSLVNRRFYRQGMNYAVENIKFFSNSAGSVDCFKTPTTWVLIMPLPVLILLGMLNVKKFLTSNLL